MQNFGSQASENFWYVKPRSHSYVALTTKNIDWDLPVSLPADCHSRSWGNPSGVRYEEGRIPGKLKLIGA